MNDEEKRISEMLKYEQSLALQGYSLVAGVDEAGRGPLAGDVFAAAAILPRGVIIEGLNDSKKLSQKKRETLFDIIKETAVAWAVGTASVEEIETINILNATHLAMNRAVDLLPQKPEYVLIDGNSIKNMTIPHQCVVKGDSLSASIAAASIIAKVSRDRYITQLSEKYPEYGFAKHKGYGTKDHIDAVRKYGLCDIHRRSFFKKILGE